MHWRCEEVRERIDFEEKGVKLKKHIILIMMLAVIMLFFLAGPAGADELLMKNGDRLQGSVVSMSLGKLVFKTSYAGDITIKWEEVATLTTDKPVEA